MSLPPSSRSRLHEVVLALCVMACLANSLRQREPRRAEPTDSAPAVTDATAATADLPKLPAAPDGTRPEAR